jgi:hypothetical protein
VSTVSFWYGCICCVNHIVFTCSLPINSSLLNEFMCKLGFFWHEWQKRPNLHKNELNTTFFRSTSPLKAPNRLKSLKLAWRFVLTSYDIYQNPLTQEKFLKFWQRRTKKYIFDHCLLFLSAQFLIFSFTFTFPSRNEFFTKKPFKNIQLAEKLLFVKIL